MRTNSGLIARYLIIVGFLSSSAFAVNPAALLSKGKQVYSNAAGASVLNDQRYDNGQSVGMSNGKWVAFNVGSGPTKVLVSWNSTTWYTWADGPVPGACSGGQYFSLLTGYTISTSSNSTNGTDGDWTTAATITGNQVSARANAVDFTGKNWVKLTFTGGNAPLSEVEVSDVSNSNDVWFFLGNSITAAAFKGSDNVPSFAEVVHASNAAFFPAMVRAGIPCIHSWDVVSAINFYLQNSTDCHYIAMEIGTNDAWGGSSNGVAGFRNNLATIITAFKNAGKEPIIGTVPATNTSWQVDPGYKRVVDSMTTARGLIQGPDFYTYFLAHQNEFSDGVHPNAAGSASYNRLWAEKMLQVLYPATSVQKNLLHHADAGKIRVMVKSGRELSIQGIISTATIHDIKGRCLGVLRAGDISGVAVPGAGTYLVRSAGQTTRVTVR